MRAGSLLTAETLRTVQAQPKRPEHYAALRGLRGLTDLSLFLDADAKQLQGLQCAAWLRSYGGPFIAELRRALQLSSLTLVDVKLPVPVDAPLLVRCARRAAISHAGAGVC